VGVEEVFSLSKAIFLATTVSFLVDF